MSQWSAKRCQSCGALLPSRNETIVDPDLPGLIVQQQRRKFRRQPWRLFKILHDNKGKLVDYDRIIIAVWNLDEPEGDIKKHIHVLTNKVRAYLVGTKFYIETIHGDGMILHELKVEEGSTMIDPHDLRHLIIIPTLKYLDLHSLAAEKLLLGTAITESSLDTDKRSPGKETALQQRGGGPARGIFQIEPITHRSIHDDFLAYKPELRDKVLAMIAKWPSREKQLASNLAYACAIARCRYRIVKEALPPANRHEDLAKYWKRYYNTHLGDGTVEHFMEQAGPFL